MELSCAYLFLIIWCHSLQNKYGSVALYQNMTAPAAASTCRCCKLIFQLIGLSTKIDPRYCRYYGKDSIKLHIVIFG
jgi:hypothetical protein